MNANEAVITGIRRPMGYQQITAGTLAAATGLTIPGPPPGNVCGYVLVQANGGTVRWRDDGTDPTPAVGMVIGNGGELTYCGDFTKIKFILSTLTPTLDVSFYA
jgi:hypothetical protein